MFVSTENSAQIKELAGTVMLAVSTMPANLVLVCPPYGPCQQAPVTTAHISRIHLPCPLQSRFANIYITKRKLFNSTQHSNKEGKKDPDAKLFINYLNL